jgi:hypothetical protein
MADSKLHVPRPKNQVLLSRGLPGIETAVPIEQEFELLRAEILAQKGAIS